MVGKGSAYVHEDGEEGIFLFAANSGDYYRLFYSVDRLDFSLYEWSDESVT